MWPIALALVSIALAAVSWRFTELPFRKLRWQPAQSVSNRGPSFTFDLRTGAEILKVATSPFTSSSKIASALSQIS
jgi:peptidoglycan/LPS O-acetylase OafA/YrhL